MSETISFLPWLRLGVGADFALDKDRDLRPQRQLTATLTATSDSGAVSPTPVAPVTVQLAGPGEIRRLDSRLITRRSPAPNTRAAPSNLFPLVEFSAPDLPWRYSPIPASGDRHHPWLGLLVLKAATAGTGESGEFQWRARRSGAPLSSIAVNDGVSLPDLDQSWAWAHVQVNGSVGSDDLPDALSSGLAISRIIAPRFLENGKAYVAFLVPTFERGRLAGLGQKPGAATLGSARAWTGTSASGLELPVFMHWSFSTSADARDFEAILDGLAGVPAPSALGTRPLRVELGGVERTLPLAGALAPVGHTHSQVDGRAALLNALAQDEADESGARPMVRPPTYAHTFVSHAMNVGDTVLCWLEDLNLDPRWRVVAGLGAEAVRAHQEAYMAAAWEIVGEVREINRRLAHERVSYFSRLGVYKHVATLGDDERRRLSVLRPLLDAQIQQMAERFNAIGALRGMSDPQLLRVARPQSALGRRTGLTASYLTQPVGLGIREGLSNVQSGLGELMAPSAALNLPKIGGFSATTSIDLGDLSDLSDLSGLGLDLDAVSGLSDLSALTGASAAAAAHGGASLGAHVLSFATTSEPAATSWLEALDKDLRSCAGTVERESDGLDDLWQALLQALVLLASTLDPDQSVASEVEAFVKANATGFQPGAAVMAVPRFDDAAADRLVELGTAWLLPGLDALDAERVTCVQTNPAFVEAFLAGMNHEFARELLWREYPTDQRGTAFARFWPALDANAAVDINDINTWPKTNKLGENQRNPEPMLVLLFHTELFSRYPGTRIYLLPATGVDEHGVHTLSWDGKPLASAFTDRFGEYAYFGFDLKAADADDEPGWFVVFEEPITEPQFGADVPVSDSVNNLQSDGALNWSNLSWAHIWGSEWDSARGRWVDFTALVRNNPTSGTSWRWHVTASSDRDAANSSEIARCAYQLRVRRAVHLSDLLPAATRLPATPDFTPIFPSPTAWQSGLLTRKL